MILYSIFIFGIMLISLGMNIGEGDKGGTIGAFIGISLLLPVFARVWGLM